MSKAARSLRTWRNRIALAAAFAGALAAYSRPQAQSAAKKPLTIEDYTKWRSIAGREISGDGKWVTYVLQQMNTTPPESKPVLQLKNLENKDPK